MDLLAALGGCREDGPEGRGVMAAPSLPTVLVVDDEPFSVASMRMALEDDFHVLEATSADEAWRLLEENWVQVVVSDQRMPGRTGVELLSDVRGRWPETVRIIVTGYTESSDMIEAINAAGIYQFITKPWHPEQFLMAVRNAARLFELSRDHERMSLEMRYLGSTAAQKLQAKEREKKLALERQLVELTGSADELVALQEEKALAMGEEQATGLIQYIQSLGSEDQKELTGTVSPEVLKRPRPSCFPARRMFECPLGCTRGTKRT